MSMDFAMRIQGNNEYKKNFINSKEHSEPMEILFPHMAKTKNRGDVDTEMLENTYECGNLMS